MKTKYIFVTGGVTSSLGKGILSASIAKLLQSRGLRVTIQKFDPYINVDPGTLNPYEHGECYVTEDGAETDLDLGHYERFLGISMTQANNVTTGRIYKTVIENEREGVYLGKTVQVVPHITDEIKRRMQLLGQTGLYDIVITEIGGVVGDIESLPYIEAVRQLQWELPPEYCMCIHLTLIPYLRAAKELKTKPTQHSVRQLQQNGVRPDVIICRSERHVPADMCRKIAMFCNISPQNVMVSVDAKSIYHVPVYMHKQGLDDIIVKHFGLTLPEADLAQWHDYLQRMSHPAGSVDIALVGKYVELQDAYKSILESFIHAGAANHCKVHVHAVHSEHLGKNNVRELLGNMDGILVAPGFGNRGLEGKIEAVKYAREHGIPFFGICLGMQMAVVEYARNVVGWADANSAEVDSETSHAVIDLMESQKKVLLKGGTMRLGAYPCTLKSGSLAESIYGMPYISERHRHRYELNATFENALVDAGLVISGVNPVSSLAEIIELPGHPFFIGVQFHPELKSTPENPHPLFVRFVEAAVRKHAIPTL